MQPRIYNDIERLALIDPVAALGILMGVKTAPVSFNATATFSSYTLGQIPIVAPLDQVIQARTWLDSATYDIQVPNAFIGSVFQSTSLRNLRASPGISVQTTVLGGPKYLVTPNFTPIDNYVNIFASRWIDGWQIAKLQTIQTQFMLTAIPFGDAAGTPPYVVTLTYNGWQFLNCSLDDICAADAIRILNDKYGMGIPQDVCVNSNTR